MALRKLGQFSPLSPCTYARGLMPCCHKMPNPSPPLFVMSFTNGPLANNSFCRTLSNGVPIKLFQTAVVHLKFYMIFNILMERHIICAALKKGLLNRFIQNQFIFKPGKLQRIYFSSNYYP